MTVVDCEQAQVYYNRPRAGTCRPMKKFACKNCGSDEVYIEETYRRLYRAKIDRLYSPLIDLERKTGLRGAVLWRRDPDSDPYLRTSKPFCAACHSPIDAETQTNDQRIRHLCHIEDEPIRPPL